MRPAFASDPVAAAIFFSTLGIWVVTEARQALNRRAEATIQDRDSLLTVRLAGAGGAILAALALNVTAAAYPVGRPVFLITLFLMWTGIGLRWWCFKTLGRYFTFQVMTSAGQPVITKGPYRVLRHPSYTAILLILVGIGLSYGNWLSLAALVLVPLLGFLNRIRVEEAALSATLGDAYTSYARGRKRLIPFVW